MVKLAYKRIAFQAETMVRIAQVNAIVEDYQAQDMRMTLRQIYYQLVARGLIENSDREYNRLQGTVNSARLAGMLDWDAIEDRTRGLSTYQYYESPREAVSRLARDYRLNKWDHQRMRPEVWVEKEALAGVVEDICGCLQVDFYSCRGYNSQSEQWRAGQRFARYIGKGQTPIVLHLGDHDPSGIDMTRDNRDRLEMFCGVRVQVVRLALNMDQVQKYAPPPNPAKMTDSRFADYRRQYGSESWELDALEPTVIHGLIRDAVERMTDKRAWDESQQQENDDRAWLRHISGEEDEDHG